MAGCSQTRLVYCESLISTPCAGNETIIKGEFPSQGGPMLLLLPLLVTGRTGSVLFVLQGLGSCTHIGPANQ